MFVKSKVNIWKNPEQAVIKIQVSDTFRQRYGDDDSISCPHPQSAAGHHQSCDSHKRETQFTSTCNTRRKVFSNLETFVLEKGVQKQLKSSEIIV